MEILKQKRLELEESYNFKEEEDKSWSFEFKNRKAFFINLADPANKNIVTPFIMRRGQLGMICDMVDDQIYRGEKPSNLGDFLSFSIEVIGNMLDKMKMGSVEHFINLIWKNIKVEAGDNTLQYLNVVNILSDIVIMVDYASEAQLATISQDQMKQIHHDYFNKNSDKIFRVHHDGSIERIHQHTEEKTKDDLKYNLAEMKPINHWEI